MSEVSKQEPLVSICIPVYNRVQYIGETIESILKQNYRNIEIVVQDNASNDGTWEFLQQMADKHPQLSIQQNKTNVGMISNWNLALNRAGGEYVGWLSSDDMIEQHFVDDCVKTFSQHQVDVVTTNFFIMGNDSKTVRRKKIPAGVYREFYDKLLWNPMLFTINFTLFTRQTVNSLSVNGKLLPKNLITFDYELWFRLALSGRTVYYLTEPLGCYRIHENNESKQKKKLRRHTVMVILHHRRALKKMCKLPYHLVMLRYMSRLLRPSTFDKRLFRVLSREIL